MRALGSVSGYFEGMALHMAGVWAFRISRGFLRRSLLIRHWVKKVGMRYFAHNFYRGGNVELTKVVAIWVVCSPLLNRNADEF